VRNILFSFPSSGIWIASLWTGCILEGFEECEEYSVFTSEFWDMDCFPLDWM
jgi:hypothetical protein